MQYHQDTDDQLKKDEDAQFEQIIEATEGEQPPPQGDEFKQSIIEGTLPGKEDTLGNSDFPPLSEKEKQPKLQDDEERIKEMNRRTSLGD